MQLIRTHTHTHQPGDNLQIVCTVSYSVFAGIDMHVPHHALECIIVSGIVRRLSVHNLSATIMLGAHTHFEKLPFVLGANTHAHTKTNDSCPFSINPSACTLDGVAVIECVRRSTMRPCACEHISNYSAINAAHQVFYAIGH